MRRILVLLACTAGTLSACPVLAEEAFVGRWAATPSVCAMRGGNSPALVATDTSLWWFDGYCRIGKMYKAKAVYVQVHCGSKGDVPVTLDAQGNRMRVTWGKGKPEDLKRCN
jgi:hypothetical protein